MIRRGSKVSVCPVCRADRDAILETFSHGRLANLKIDNQIYKPWYWLDYDDTNLFTGGIVGYVCPLQEIFKVGQIRKVDFRQRSIAVRVIPRSRCRNKVGTKYSFIKWTNVACIFEVPSENQ